MHNDHSSNTESLSPQAEAPNPQERKIDRRKEPRGGGKFSLFLIGIIRWGAYAALFAPLVVHPEFFFPFVVPKTVFFWVFAEIIFAAWLILAVSNKQFRPRWNPLSVALGVFIVVTIIASFTGINTERSFWSTFERMAGTINWIHFTMFFFALSSTFRSLNDWKKLLSVSLVPASLVSIIFLLQKIGAPVIPFETRGGSTIGNSSFMAAYLLFNVFFGIWLFSRARDVSHKLFYAAALILIVFSVLIATAYGALLSMLGGFFIIFLAWLFFKQKIMFARAIAASLLFAGIFIAGVITYGTFTQDERIIDKLPYFFSDEGTIGARKVIWEMAWKGVKDRPILGWGTENFNVVFTKYFNPCLPLSECGGEVWFDRTHNIFLDNLIASGVIGLFSYLALFVAALFLLWKNFLHTRDDWVMPSIVTAALASYFAQNFLVFDMLNTYLMFAFTLAFVGGVYTATDKYRGSTGPGDERIAEDEHKTHLNNPRPAVVFIVGVFLVYYLFSFGIQSLQSAHWGIRINRGSMSPEDLIVLYEKSLSATPLGNRQTVEFITNNITQAVEKEDIDPVLIKRVGEIMEKSVENSPMDFRQLLLLGNFYTAARDFNPEYINKAEEVLSRAIELAPTNQFGYISISQVYISIGEYEKSILALKKAVDLEPRYSRVHNILGEVYMIGGDKEKAEESFKRAKELGS